MPASSTQSFSSASTRKPLIRDTILDPSGKGINSSGNSSEGWTMQFRPVQIGLIWLSTLLLMVFVFLFGLRAGHQRGREEALEQSTDQLVRLPVARSGQPEVAELVSLPSAASAIASTSSDAPTGNLNQSAPLVASSTAESLTAGSPAKAEIPVQPLQPVAKVEAPSSPGFATKEATAVIHSADTSSRAALNGNGSSRTADVPTSRAMLATAPSAATTSDIKSSASLVESAPIELSKVEAKRSDTKPSAAKPSATDSKTAAANLKRAENNSASLVQDPRSGWYVQLAASNSTTEASDLGKKLKARGLSPTIQKTKVKNVMYSRVLVGPYANRVAALDDQQKIKSWGISKGEPFLRYLSD